MPVFKKEIAQQANMISQLQECQHLVFKTGIILVHMYENMLGDMSFTIYT